jgi:hypothetical protein
MGTLMPAKKREQWVQRHPPERIKDSPYFQRFPKK